MIEPIEWTEDGWYRTVSAATPVTPEQEIKHGLELSDDFKGPQLGLQWTFWKEYAPKSLTFKEDILWMKAKGRTSADGRVLLTTAEDKNYETQVEIRTGNGNVAGLILYYNEKVYAESFPMERDSIFTGMRSTRRNFPIVLGNISLPDCTLLVTVCPSR